MAEVRGRFGGKPSANGGPSKYTLAEIAAHDSPTDCWLIIRGKVYDVTEWVPKHPGGALIYVRAGYDCTQIFDSYHPLYVRKVLDKYCIGEVDADKGAPPAPPGGLAPLLHYADEEEEDFYFSLKRKVEAYLKQNKINPRFSFQMYVKTAVILGSLVPSYYGAFYAFSSLLPSLLCALTFGFMAAEVGVSIMHDANHGSYSRRNVLTYLMSATLDLVGASSFMWRQQHVVGHHAYTNVDGRDPDIRVKDPDVRRVTKAQPWQPYHVYQHLYLGFLYGLLALKSIVADDFMAYFKGHIGSVRVARMTALETAIFFGGKAFYAAYMVAAPLLWSRHDLLRLVLLFISLQLITGWTLALMFQVAHVTPDVAYPQALPAGTNRQKVAMGWAAAQVATTADFCRGSWLWMHISGGLSYQIEHHLFPGVCHVHYPAISGIVEETCKEFNVPYFSYPSFWVALKAHFKHLQMTGATAGDLRLEG
eukprot:jgi/Mesvir1/16237/Mv08490-RA.1